MENIYWIDKQGGSHYHKENCQMLKGEYVYKVIWSDEDGEYVALCNQFPSLSSLDKTKHEALKVIKEIVVETIKEMNMPQRHHYEPITRSLPRIHTLDGWGLTRIREGGKYYIACPACFLKRRGE